MATTNAMFTITDTGDLSGRNLLQRSFFTKDPWTGPTYNAVGEGFGTYHERKCLPVTARDLYENTNKGVDTIFPDLTFEEGVQYTISGNWAQFRTDNYYNKMQLRIHHTDETRVTISQPQQNNIWSSFTLTSTPGKTIDKITVTFSRAGITYIENFKLEVGASATDWTPAPEDVNDVYLDAKTANETADYAKTEIDGLEIGGRNLILKGDEEHTKTLTTEGANAVVPAYSFSLYGRPLAHTEGQIMTVSFDYETSGNSLDTGRIYLQHNNAMISSKQIASIYLNDAPSGRYVRTYTITSAQAASSLDGTVRVYITGCSAGTVVNVKNMKVELGNRATDWTPAPEDVEEAIESKNSVYYQATAPTAHKVGDTWFDTAHDYKISRWDGSQWVAAELGDAAFANISASKITAGSVMGNVILGGTIQAGGSNVGHQDGEVLVKDANDELVASLSKDGLVVYAGSIGGWTITPTAIEKQKYDTSVTPAEYSITRLNSASNALQLRKGQHDVYIFPDYISQHTAISSGVDEPKITMKNGDITYSNVFMPIPNEESMSFRKWTTVSPARTIKGPLQVTVYHCMNLFWAHFSGTIPAGWNSSNTQDVFVPIITGDTDLSKSVNVAPPINLTKYIIPTDLTNMRISVTVRSDGQLGISRVAEPFKGNATATIAGYMETCDIFWAHIG